MQTRMLLGIAAMSVVLAGCGGGGTRAAQSTTPPTDNTTTVSPSTPSTTGTPSGAGDQLRVVNLFSPPGAGVPPALDVHVTDNGDQVLVAGLAFGKASAYLAVPHHATLVIDTVGKRDGLDAKGSKFGGADLQTTMVIVANPDKAGVADAVFFTERNATMDEFALPVAPAGKALLFANAEALPFGKSPAFDLGTPGSGCLTKDLKQEGVAVSGNQTIRYPLGPGHVDIAVFKGLDTPPCANQLIGPVGLDAAANHRYLLLIFGIGSDYRSMVLPIA